MIARTVARPADSWRIGLRRSLGLPIALGLLAVVAIVPPAGDFPLNDDWVYARMVRELVENHTFFVHPFSFALAITSTVWGALFASVFGASHTVLRCSTLLLAGVAVWATARGARECDLPRASAFLCGALVLANPIFLNLSYTFMTDVPSAAWLSLAGWFQLRALRGRRPSDALWGGAFLTIAIGTRQIGVVVIAAFLLTEVVSSIRDRRRPDARLLLAFAAPLVVGGALYWTAFAPALGDTVSAWPAGRARPTILESVPRLLHHGAAALVYMGLFTLPIGLGRLAALAARADHRSLGQWVAFALVCIGMLLGSANLVHGRLAIERMPMLPNVLYDLGTGPFTLRDVFLIADNTPVSLGPWWWAIHLLATASAGLLIVDVLSVLWRWGAGGEEPLGERWLFLTAWVGSLTLLPYYLITETLFDRYLLAALPPVTILAAGCRPRADSGRVLWTAWVGTLAIFVFSLACVQDYLAWNTARWKAIDHLRFERGIPALQIDGGFEYNGMYLSEEFRRRHAATQFWDMGAGWFWVLEETRYSVFASYIPGCRPETSFPYRSWLGFETRHLFVVHCEPSPI